MEILFAQSNNIFLHFIEENISGLFCYFIAWLYYHYRAANGLSTLMAVTFFTAGSIDLLHAYASFIPAFQDGGVPLTWFFSRGAVISGLLVASSKSISEDGVSNRVLIALFLLPVTLCIVTINAVVQLNEPFRFVYQEGFIKRPLDFILLVGWIVAMLRLTFTGVYKRMFPPVVFELFVVLGVLVHALMAFHSTASFDKPFMWAHFIKIAEYIIFVWMTFVVRSQLHAEAQHEKGAAQT